jgi:hypothetical protein
MGLCVQLNGDGTVTPTGQTVEDCTAYVLASPGEAWLSSIVQQAFEVPADLEVLAGWWLGSFSLVLVSYMAGWCVGQVIKTVR